MSAYKSVEFHIQGLAPSLMNNGRLANPMDPFAKAVKAIYDSKGRGKTLPDDKMVEMFRYQFLGALYVDEDKRACWPGSNLEAMLLTAAKSERKGKDAQRSIIVDGTFPLGYEGPKDPEKLWERESFRHIVMAKRGNSPVLTCRPIFHQWELEFTVHYLPEQINEETIRNWVDYAGPNVGLSDWRPKFGRFMVNGK